MLKDNVIYMILNERWFSKNAIEIEIKKSGNCTEHLRYLRSLCECHGDCFEDVTVFDDLFGFCYEACNLGDIAFINGTIEVQDDKTSFVCFLPSNPIQSQIEVLINKKEELDSLKICDLTILGEGEVKEKFDQLQEIKYKEINDSDGNREELRNKFYHEVLNDYIETFKKKFDLESKQK